jgi:hypothetical protein
LTVAIHQVERSAPPARVAAGNEGRAVAVKTSGANGAARLLQQRVECVLRPRPIEYVAGTQCELGSESAGELLVDALKLDASDDAFVEGDRQNT